MRIAICILAKDEERTIDTCLTQIAAQSLSRDRSQSVTVHVVANGCTDRTAGIARQWADPSTHAALKVVVHDLPVGGKSRSWNHAVHEIVGTTADVLMFIDADVRLASDDVLAHLIALLEENPSAAVASGFPMKDIANSQKKSLLDRFSLAVSRESRHVSALNGSLYAARASFLSNTWLPNKTPGEDGFLNAMLSTDGFTIPHAADRIVAATSPTHFFEAHEPTAFYRHERRMFVGTMINRWLFEHLWSLKATAPIGPTIRDWNERDPDWVDRVVQERVKAGNWLIAKAVLLGRFERRAERTWVRAGLYFPIALLATAVSLPSAIAANRVLKKAGAAGTW